MRSKAGALLLGTLSGTSALTAEPADLAECIDAAQAAGAQKDMAEAMYAIFGWR